MECKKFWSYVIDFYIYYAILFIGSSIVKNLIMYNGTILTQSLPEAKRVDYIKDGITFKVAEKKVEVIEPTEPNNPEEGNTTENTEKPETPTPGENTEEQNNE